MSILSSAIPSSAVASTRVNGAAKGWDSWHGRSGGYYFGPRPCHKRQYDGLLCCRADFPRHRGGTGDIGKPLQHVLGDLERRLHPPWGGRGFAAGEIRKPLVAALLTGAAVALGPVALADGGDDQFLSALAAAGIPAHDGIPAVIAHGHNVCDALSAGMSPGEAANELAQHALAEDPSHPFDQYLRTMEAFVRVSTQTFCPGRAGVAYRHGGRVIFAGLKVPSPPPQLPEVPDVIHFAPPVQVAPKPKQTPPPVQKPPPPPKVIPPPAEGSQGGQGKGGTGGGLGGGGTSSGGTQPAPDPSGGHIVLLP